MEIGKRFHAEDRAVWRTWLAENWNSTAEIWLVRYKKHTRVECVPYDDAVEEALCFGWIDGLVKRENEETYVIRFSPRRPGSIWSRSNKARVEKMLAAGLMEPPGLALVEHAKRSGAWDKADLEEDPENTPEELQTALNGTPAAMEFYNSLTVAQRKQYNIWIHMAKKARTRERRATVIVDRCARQIKPGIV